MMHRNIVAGKPHWTVWLSLSSLNSVAGIRAAQEKQYG